MVKNGDCYMYFTTIKKKKKRYSSHCLYTSNNIRTLPAAVGPAPAPVAISSVPPTP